MFLFANQEKRQLLLLKSFRKSIPSCPLSLETDMPNKWYWQGQQPASGCYRQDFSKSNKHHFGHAGERQHAHQPFSPTSFCSIASLSVYSSCQPFVLFSPGTLPTISLWKRTSEENLSQFEHIWKNTFKSVNVKQNQGYC